MNSTPFRVTAFALLASAAMVVPSAAAETEWKYFGSVPAGHDVGKIIIKGFERINQRTNDKLKITYTFYGETPYKPTEGLILLRDELVDLTEWLPAYNAGTYPLLSGPELPLLVPRFVPTTELHKLADASWNTETMKAYETKVLDDHGAVRVTRVFYEPMNLWFKGEFNGPADLTGMKIRAFSPEQSEFLSAMGATPVTIPGPEVYTALQRGLVDGTIIGSSAIVSFKLDEVVKTGYLTNLQQLSTGMLASKGSIDALPEDVKAIFLEEMAAVEAEARAFIPEQEKRDVSILEGKGITIKRPAEDVYSDLHKVAVDKVFPKWVGRAGEGSQNFLDESLKAAGE